MELGQEYKLKWNDIIFYLSTLQIQQFWLNNLLLNIIF